MLWVVSWFRCVGRGREAPGESTSSAGERKLLGTKQHRRERATALGESKILGRERNWKFPEIGRARGESERSGGEEKVCDLSLCLSHCLSCTVDRGKPCKKVFLSSGSGSGQW